MMEKLSLSLIIHSLFNLLGVTTLLPALMSKDPQNISTAKILTKMENSIGFSLAMTTIMDSHLVPTPTTTLLQ
jgi:hypothetical protein